MYVCNYTMHVCIPVYIICNIVFCVYNILLLLVIVTGTSQRVGAVRDESTGGSSDNPLSHSDH